MLDNAIATNILCAAQHANSEAAHLQSLACVFVTVPKPHVLARMSFFAPYLHLFGKHSLKLEARFESLLTSFSNNLRMISLKHSTQKAIRVPLI